MTAQSYQTLLSFLQHYEVLIYAAAFFFAFIKSVLIIGAVIPGGTLLLMLGAFSATGQIDFWGIFLLGIVGSVTGDALNFILGKHYGMQWLERHQALFIKPPKTQQAYHFFARNGGKSVFLGRFIPVIKEIIPFIAGAVGTPTKQFFFWDTLSGILWCLQWIGSGYLFGTTLLITQTTLERIVLLVLIALILIWAVWFLKRRKYH